MIDKGSDFDDKLPTIPEMTPERLAEIDKAQAALAKSHPIDASKREFSNALARIKELEGLKRLTSIQREKYAEALASTGRFDAAAKTTKNKDKRKRWNAVWKAVFSDKQCKCQDEVQYDEHGQAHTFSRHFIVNQIFSHQANQLVPLIGCNKCGGLHT